VSNRPAMGTTGSDDGRKDARKPVRGSAVPHNPPRQQGFKSQVDKRCQRWTKGVKNRFRGSQKNRFLTPLLSFLTPLLSFSLPLY
jgi:hypothetical protein